MEPLFFRSENSLQLSYDIPHRIYCAETYPLQSPNGSAIIIYGHEQGLRIIWWGGKPFKDLKAQANSEKVNGTSNRYGEAEVIDLDDDDDDDDEPASTTKPVEAHFEDEEEETDPSQPYQKVLRYIDVNLRTDVIHLGLPSIPSDLSEASPGAYPELFSSHIIVAVACSDAVLRVITLPLRPPAPENRDPSRWNLNIAKLDGTEWLNDPFSSVSITHHCEDVDDAVKPRSRSRGPPTTTPTKRNWFFLIASASDSAGGILFIHQLPIGIAATDIKQSTLQPIQQEFLNTGVGNKLTFNPSAYPAGRYSDVLIAHPGGTVKLYRCFSDQIKRLSSSRRGSNATTDSFTSTGKVTSSGKFMLTISCDFSKQPGITAHREGILDATWVLGGRAILVLLQNGQWGIWDVEGASPALDSKPAKLWQRSNDTGLSSRKGGIAKFSLQGHISPITENRSTQEADVKDSTADGPTRGAKVGHAKGGTFFKNARTTNEPSKSGSYTNGRISIVELDSDHSSPNTPDESIILTYGSQNISIPSLLSLWRAQASDQGTLDPLLSVRPTILPDVRIPSGRQVDVAHLPPSTSNKSRINRTGRISSPQNVNVVLAFERRLILIVRPTEKAGPDDTMKALVASEVDQEDEDRMLLDQGELDIDGMDRILDGMDRSTMRSPGGIGTGRLSGIRAR